MGPNRRAALAAASLLALFGAAAARAETHVVTIENMVFSPAALTVRRGDTVSWRNKDLVPHTATAKGAFDSGNIAPGKSWSHQFKAAANLDYGCTYHPSMKAAVVVQ